MISQLLPNKLLLRLGDLNKLCEIRLRVGKPIMVGDMTTYRILEGEPCSTLDIDSVLSVATDHSLYRVSDMLKRGFITYKGGIRIGVCGELTEENGQPITMKNITSLVIRLPRNVRGCAEKHLPYLASNNPYYLYHTLIFSPPGGGKTTFLRDICFGLSRLFPSKNLLVLDERGELSGADSLRGIFDLGHNVDVLYASSKAYSVEISVKSLRPDIILCDELVTREDFYSLQYASTMGVKIFSTIHADTLLEVEKKPCFFDGVFERFLQLSNRQVVGIYGEKKERLL